MSRLRNRMLLGFAGALALGIPGVLLSSDHQDTPEVELNQRCDINDVYAFPGSTPGSIALVLTTASPIVPGTALSFDPDKLYQIKIDNDATRDGLENYVLQFKFRGTGAAQQVDMRGPVAVSGAEAGTLNKLRNVAASATGTVGTTITGSNGIKLFAGLRDDPFFLDLSQFFRIIPDRRPVTGALSMLPATPSATCFRAPGVAEDYLRGLNCLAIVVEMPASLLTGTGGGKLGIWGTLSR